MKHVINLTSKVVLVCLLVSCGAQTSVPPTATLPHATATTQQIAEETVGPEATADPAPFPLSEPGTYYTGRRMYTFVDTNRSDREIGVTLFYPALLPEGSTGNKVFAGIDRDPDLSGAPYPLILTGKNSGEVIFKAHLASHGFVMAIVRHPDHYDDLDLQTVDHPRDFLFVLDQLASSPMEGLDGVIDTEQVGVTGYSWDGFISLALSGVRIDPEFYLAHCEQAAAMQALVPWDGYTEYYCTLAGKWTEFVAHIGEEMTTSNDGLWQALTDERIRAVAPMAPDGAWLYGERGLALANRPMLIIAPTDDEYTPYEIETTYIFEHAGSPERFLVSFVGRSHMMPYDPEAANRMNHFATAFFGAYLQGREDLARYFSEEFVAQRDDLAWGVYAGED